MTKVYFLLTFFSITANCLFAQVAINKNTAHASAALDISGNNDPDFRGLLIPSMSSLNRKKIPSPAEGLMVYDTDKKLFYFFETTWKVVSPWTLTTPDGPDVDASTLLSIGLDNNVKTVSISTPVTMDSLLTTKKNVLVKDTVKASVLEGFGTIPIGGIIMWSGKVVPAGWELCDGSLNYTGGILKSIPNLQGQFIVGYDSTQSDYSQPGNLSTGGTTAGNKGGLKEVTLTTTQLPSHDHTGVTKLDGNHSHNYIDYYRNTTSDGGGGGLATRAHDGFESATRQTDSDLLSAHKHYFTTDKTGGGLPHENRPPYYTLAYIIRVK